jgi:hypothetical protein
MPYGTDYEDELCECFADLIFYDMPYGILPLAWDVQMTLQEVTMLLKQVDAVQRKNNTMVCFMHTTEAACMIRQALRSRNFQDLQDWFWYKVDHFGTGPVSSYTNTVEMGTMAWNPNARGSHWKMDLDSRHRHNLFQCGSETLMIRDADQQLVNPTQKPPALMQWLCGNHVPPNGNVLIIGPGAGGDVRGAINACANVVAVERDFKQFEILQTTLNKVHAMQVREMAADVAAKEAAAKEAATPTVLNTQLSQDSTSVPATGEDAKEVVPPTCPECDTEIVGGDPLFICCMCDEATQLHPNCGLKLGGDVYCNAHRGEAGGDA